MCTIARSQNTTALGTCVTRRQSCLVFFITVDEASRTVSLSPPASSRREEENSCCMCIEVCSFCIVLYVRDAFFALHCTWGSQSTLMYVLTLGGSASHESALGRRSYGNGAINVSLFFGCLDVVSFFSVRWYLHRQMKQGMFVTSADCRTDHWNSPPS